MGVLGCGILAVFVGLGALFVWLGIATLDEGGAGWLVMGALLLGAVVWFFAAGARQRRIEGRKTDAERAGYVKVNEPEGHCTQCPTPRFTGQKADVRVGIGSVWECPRCHRRWVLVEHEHETSMYRTRTSRWRLATAGE